MSNKNARIDSNMGIIWNEIYENTYKEYLSAFSIFVAEKNKEGVATHYVSKTFHKAHFHKATVAVIRSCKNAASDFKYFSISATKQSITILYLFPNLLDLCQQISDDELEYDDLSEVIRKFIVSIREKDDIYIESSYIRRLNFLGPSLGSQYLLLSNKPNFTYGKDKIGTSSKHNVLWNVFDT